MSPSTGKIKIPVPYQMQSGTFSRPRPSRGELIVTEPLSPSQKLRGGEDKAMEASATQFSIQQLTMHCLSLLCIAESHPSAVVTTHSIKSGETRRGLHFNDLCVLVLATQLAFAAEGRRGELGALASAILRVPNGFLSAVSAFHVCTSPAQCQQWHRIIEMD